MDPTAAAAPLTRDGAPLFTLRPLIYKAAKHLHMRALYGVAATASGRVFVRNQLNGQTIELTADGVVVRAFHFACITRISSLAVAEGRLFAASPDAVAAVAVCDVEVADRQLKKAGQQLGCPAMKSPLSFPWGLLVVDDLLFVATPQNERIDIVQLTAPFV
jgi:hypothetical protein